MKTMLIRSALIASICLISLTVDTTMAQSQSRSQAGSSSKSAPVAAKQQIGLGQKMGLGQTQEAKKPKSPWKISSRIHLQKGTNEGYIVVQLDLNEGYHVYSLNPKGSPSPTKFAVLPSNDLKVTSKFMADKNPKVIEKDPVFQQRIEKHAGQIQFFAPIAVRPGIDLQKLKQEVQFSGQICSESSCQPIRAVSSTASFSGYFEVPKARNAAGTQKLK